MTRQPHINEKMRAILVDWLVEVHLKFKLVPETLYLTVNLIDRFLELETVERSRLQLVGVTGLLLAAKYEEIYPPELRDLVYITDKAYTKEEILAMEERMLKALDYKVTIASTHCFLVRYLKAAPCYVRAAQEAAEAAKAKAKQRAEAEKAAEAMAAQLILEEEEEKAAAAKKKKKGEAQGKAKAKKKGGNGK